MFVAGVAFGVAVVEADARQRDGVVVGHAAAVFVWQVVAADAGRQGGRRAVVAVIFGGNARGGAARVGGGDGADVFAREGACEVAHRVATLQDAGLGFVDVVQEEAAFVDVVEPGFEGGAVEALGAGAGEAVGDAGAVLCGLHAADEPGAGVGERFVVEIDRVLGGEDEAEAVGARLFEEGEQRFFAGRVGAGRQVAVEFVHVEDGAQGAAAALAAHPGDEVAEQQGDEGHAFGVV